MVKVETGVKGMHGVNVGLEQTMEATETIEKVKCLC
jgi:hypothetical protein